MDRRTRILIVIGLGALLLTLGVAVMNRAAAQGVDAAATTLPDRWEYTAKFACGFQDATGNPPGEPGVKLGNYATSINFFNPAATKLVIWKRVVLLSREEYGKTILIPPTKRFKEGIPSNNAIGVDCTEIVNLLILNNPAYKPPLFIAGFVTIESSASAQGPAEALDVVATYTTAVDPKAPVNSLEVVPITGRRLAAGTWPN